MEFHFISFCLDGNPPSASSSTSSNDANLTSLTNVDLKVECPTKVKLDAENKQPTSNLSSQLTTEKLNDYNLRRDMTQENVTPLTVAVGGASRTHMGPVSSSPTKLRK